jgi:HK97 family phage prohead protease
MLSNRTIEGWLIRYGQRSRPLALPNGRTVYEIIEPDAFRDSVAAINAGLATIEANIEHRKDDALMRLGTTDLNVTVEHRAEGVYAAVKLMPDSISEDLFVRIESGMVRGLSVEFAPAPGVEAAYEVLGDGNYLRRWSTLLLRGFAVVAEPAYSGSTITRTTAAPADATFARSLSAADAEQAAADIARIEATKQRQYYEYQGFLLGVRQ